MNTLTNLLKDHQIGKWCKRAAWVILAVGLLEIVFDIYAISRQFGYGSPPLTLSELGQIAGYGIAVLPSILFYFFILYAAGALVNKVVADVEDESTIDKEEDQIDMVGDEEPAPGQMR